MGIIEIACSVVQGAFHAPIAGKQLAGNYEPRPVGAGKRVQKWGFRCQFGRKN